MPQVRSCEPVDASRISRPFLEEAGDNGAHLRMAQLPAASVPASAKNAAEAREAEFLGWAKALEGGTEAEKTRAIWLLSNSQDKRAPGILLAFLERNMKDPHYAANSEEAILAYEKVAGKEQFLDFILRALECKNSTILHVVFEKLDKYKDMRAIPPLKLILQNCDQYFYIHADQTGWDWRKEENGLGYSPLEAAMALYKLGDISGMDFLIENIHFVSKKEGGPIATSEWIRRYSIQLLSEIKEKKALFAIVSAFDDKELVKGLGDFSAELFRGFVIECLGRTGDEDAVDTIINAYRQGNYRMRATAIGALGKIHSEKAGNFILEEFGTAQQLFSCKDSEYYGWDKGDTLPAAVATGNFRDKKGASVLMEAFNSYNEKELRGYLDIAEALAKIGAKECIDFLKERLTDENLTRRFAAAYALVKESGDMEAFKAVSSVFREMEEDLRVGFVAAVISIKNPPQEVISFLISIMNSDTSYAVSLSSAKRLLEIMNEDGQRAFDKNTKDAVNAYLLIEHKCWDKALALGDAGAEALIKYWYKEQLYGPGYRQNSFDFISLSKTDEEFQKLLADSGISKANSDIMMLIYKTRQGVPLGLTDAGLGSYARSWEFQDESALILGSSESAEALSVLNNTDPKNVLVLVQALVRPFVRQTGVPQGAHGRTYASCSAEDLIVAFRQVQLSKQSLAVKLLIQSGRIKMPSSVRAEFDWSNAPSIIIPLPDQIFWCNKDIPVLTEMLNSPYQLYREEAAKALKYIEQNGAEDEGLEKGVLPGKEKTQDLRKRLNDPNWQIRYRALEALRISGADAEAFIPELKAAFTSDNYYLSEQASAILTAMGNGALPAFVESIRTGADFYKTRAIASIVKIGGKEAIAVLKALSKERIVITEDLAAIIMNAVTQLESGAK